MRRVCLALAALEAALPLAAVGSVLAIGAVHPWAYVPLWFLCGLLGATLAYCARKRTWLRRRCGARRIALNATGQAIVEADEQAGLAPRCRLDLSEPGFALGPLWLPGLALVIWIVLQLVPLPAALVAKLSPGQVGLLGVSMDGWRPLTLSPSDTLRGLGFVVALLAVHAVAATVLRRHDAAWRFVVRIAWLGALLGLVGVAQQASGTKKIYGVFQPRGPGLIYGPFVNRNHFAGYLLLCLPMAILVVARAWTRCFAGRQGRGLRQRLIALAGAEGGTLAYAILPAIFIGTALLASTSRGAIVAGLGGFILALTVRRQERLPILAVGLVLAGVGAYWLGIERLERRFAAAPADLAQRMIVWNASGERLRGFWLAGSGFNTFSQALNRPRLWTLPRGATPLEASILPPGVAAANIEYRKLMIDPQGRNFGWFSEAHDDYLQIWIEAGVPGLLLAAWAAFAALRFVRGNPWILAAIGAVLVHELVDFDLQIPANALLFVCVAALRVEADGPETTRRTTAASA